MTEHVLKLLGEVVAPSATGGDLRARVDAAVALAVEDGGLPGEVEEALNGLMAEAQEARLRGVQQAVVRSGVWQIGVARFVALVARLAAEGHLKIPDAARALARLPHPERRRLPQAAQHLLDVADAVVEDACDGVMEIEDDETFRKALGDLDTSMLT